MEYLLNSCRENLIAMQQRAERVGVSTDESISSLQTDIQALQENALKLSKCCLNDLIDCNDQFVSMTNDINSIEGLLNLIKYQHASKALPEGAQRKYDLMVPTLRVETEPPQDMPLPNSSFQMNLHILDEIGYSMSSLEDEKQLIREIPPRSENVQLWSRSTDYFLTKDLPVIPSICEVYGVQPPRFEEKRKATARNPYGQPDPNAPAE